MEIIIIHKDCIDRMPPLASVMSILVSLGYKVSLITCGISNEMCNFLNSLGVVYHIVPFNGATSPHKKIYEYYRFRNSVFRYIDSLMNQDKMLWIEGANTIVSLGSGIKKFNYILQISELHEKSKLQLSAIRRVISQAKAVFMPEYSRTILYQVWFNLAVRPVVLPNKPYYIPSQEELSALKIKYDDKLSVFSKRKCILYQGHISAERNLSSYIQAIKELGDPYQLVLLGTDHGMLNKYKEIDSNIVHFNFLPPPDYLVFTSMAYIGLVTYSPMTLNTTFCAPNKIFEYSRFGLPMLGNDIPGLIYTIEKHGAGVLVDETKVDQIKNAIIRMDNDYDLYRKNSRKLFESVDNNKTIKSVLDNLTEKQIKETLDRQ